MPTPTSRPVLKRPAYHVWVAPTGTDPDTATEDELDYHHVVVHHADQLRAELEASKLKLDARKFPMHLSSLWLWASMVRTGAFDATYAEFKRAMVAYDPDKDRDAPHTADDDERDEHDARPTAASTS
jgi:hypothetical protein